MGIPVAKRTGCIFKYMPLYILKETCQKVLSTNPLKKGYVIATD